MSQKRVSFKVHGVVQGVNYRSFAQSKANALRITGWVKNSSDGKVVGEAQGPHEALQSYLKELNTGPRAAHVVKVEKEEQQSIEGEFSFEVR